MCIPLGLALFRSSDEEPVVDIAKRVWHERLCFIMTPLTVYNKLVLVIPARSFNSMARHELKSITQHSTDVQNHVKGEHAPGSPRGQVHHYRKHSRS